MKRVVVFDNIKFFLIVLVIYGHLTNIGCLVPGYVYSVIYSFHMPLFVFLSGYFTKKHDPKFNQTVLNLFLLYVVFCLLSWSVNICVYHKPAFSSIYRTPFALWYLLCLVYWKTIIHFTSESILKGFWFFLIALIVSVLPLFLMLDFFSISRCLSFFPFFLLGWLAKENNWINKFDGFLNESRRNRVNCIIVGCLLSLVCCIIAILIPVDIYWGLNPVKYPFFLVLVYKVLSWIIAVVISATIYLLMPKQRGLEEGKHTLFYYLFHTILLFPIFDLLVDYLPYTVFTTFAVLGCVLLSLFLLRKVRFLNALLTIGKRREL